MGTLLESVGTEVRDYLKGTTLDQFAGTHAEKGATA
jgi:hypothetical protein